MDETRGNVQTPRLLRRLPSVDALKRRHEKNLREIPESMATTICREAIDSGREAARTGKLKGPDELERLVDSKVVEGLRAIHGPILRRVLNGTGVLVHTNAGRAPLSQASLLAISETSRGYCNLEVSLETGQRGSRQDLLRPLLRWLSGAEDALVVNNGAAAIMLALHALASGRPVIVSRGELVEIGGSFRVPDVMRAAGAKLVEVGTTNRTHLRDYAQALDDLEKRGDPAAALLQVHRSNFEIKGFVATPKLEELVALAQSRGLPMIADLGSGAPADLGAYSLAKEPTVAEVVAAGTDVVTFSGDKLIGGPQAGLIAGRQALIAKMGSNAMARALRIDSTVIAALEPVLRAHLLNRASIELPLYRAAALEEADLDRVGASLLAHLRQHLDERWHLELRPAEARVGGGSLPGSTMPSRCLSLRRHGLDASALQAKLRQTDPPTLGRARGSEVLLDLRSLLAGTSVDPQRLQLELATALRALEPIQTLESAQSDRGRSF